jgi:ribosomal protein S18 acetylase RimI-like enzyme
LLSPAFIVRPLAPTDRVWLPALIRERWGDEIIVILGTIYRPAELPGFAVEAAGNVVGFATYQITGANCELVSLASLRPNQGIGTALLDHVHTAARATGCSRAWLITTNDNLHALGFYQRRGYALAALYRDAVTVARAIKPAIPLRSADGIPIRDEIMLEYSLR